MDFISETFPETRVHISLFKLTGEGVAISKLTELLGTYRHNFTIINASLVASLTHLNIAVSRALLNKRDGKLRTETFGNEIVYFCDQQYSIQQSLTNYGL